MPFAHKREGSFKKPTKIVIARTITYIFVTGIDKLKTSPDVLFYGLFGFNFLVPILMTSFALHSSRFSGQNVLGHLPFDRRTLMEKLAPAVTPGDAFHTMPANVAMPAAPETADRNTSNPVYTFCADADAATTVRKLSAAY
jgi:hypothetical protein